MRLGTRSVEGARTSTVVTVPPTPSVVIILMTIHLILSFHIQGPV